MSDRTQDSVANPSNFSEAASGGTAAGLPPVPTTKVLAIGRFVESLTPEQQKVMLPKELPANSRMYLEGQIDQWWFRRDGKEGVVFLMNTTSVEEASRVLEGLPLQRTKLLTFELIPLGPLAPLYVLLDDSQAGDAA